MKIIHIAAELHPIAKAGGLGDVVYGLAKEQLRLGHEVEIIIPKYNSLQLHRLKELDKNPLPFFVHDPDKQWATHSWHGLFDQLPITFLEIEHPAHPFNRDSVYGYNDDPYRFGLFCRSAIAYLRQKSSPSDILHAHDWHTALALALNKEGPPVAKGSVISIHNALYQGKCHADALGYTEINLRSPIFQDPFDPALINLLKAGILFSDRVTTVSPTYAHDVQYTHDGCGLQSIFHQKQVRGIINGIDYEYWNPLTDPLIAHRYERSDIKNLAAARQKNRQELQQELGMDPPKGPLVACITRLVDQKGPQLIKAALLETIESGGQAILLATSAPSDLAHEFSMLAESLKTNRDIHFDFGFNEILGHKLYSSADLLLIPSIFEPCGLTQMIAMRYGAIPLARETGGLADTVKRDVNGFSFGAPDRHAIIATLKHAFNTYRNPDRWQAMLHEGDKIHFTWSKSALEYQDLYLEILRSKPS